MAPLNADARPRRIVKLAASRAKIESVRTWLERDERGTWESDAADLLGQVRERAVELKMTDEQLDDAVADRLLLRALQATLNHERKRKAR